MSETPNHASTTEHTLLVDIYQQMGRVEGQNELILREQERASESRRGVNEAIDRMRIDMAAAAQNIASVAGRVTELEPNVAKMTAFRVQVSLAVVFVTAVVSGAINIVWIGVSHFDQIKGALRAFLR